jgi:hypothetical protein
MITVSVSNLDKQIPAAREMAIAKAEPVEFRAHGRTVLRITARGDIEEIQASPLRVRVGDRLASLIADGPRGTGRNNAIAFARRYLNVSLRDVAA